MKQILSILLMGYLLMVHCKPSLAQEDQERYGHVVDETGRGIPSVRVSIDGVDSFVSDNDGIFKLPQENNEELPLSVLAIKEGWETASWSFLNNKKLQLVMRKSKYKLLFGYITKADGTPAANYSVFLPGTEPPVLVETDDKGHFKMVLPTSVPLDNSVSFKIKEHDVVSQTFEFKGTYNYHLSIEPIPDFKLPGRVFTGVVKNSNGRSIANTRVEVGNISYITNLDGKFKAVVVNPDDGFDVEGYRVASINPNQKGDRVEIIVNITSALRQQRRQDSLFRVEYQRLLTVNKNRRVNDTSALENDFQQIINAADTASTQDLNGDMTIVANKLEEDDAQLTTAARDTLKAYLAELDQLLMEKDMMSKESQETRALIERLRENLLEKNEILALLEKEKERQANEFKTRMLYSVIALLCLLIIIFIALYFARKFKKQKVEISSVKQNLEDAFVDLKSHSTKTIDSIRYAKTIQRAILPSEAQLKSFLKDYFIIYRPKDIVSGDAYWFLDTSEYTGTNSAIIAVIDCTGHGVPGGFMTMIGNTLLSEIVKESENKLEPEEILETLNERVIDALRQKEKVNDDGMDICLCKLEKLSEEVTRVSFCGAKRPLYYVNSKTQSLQYSKGTNKSIGGVLYKKRKFETESLFLQKGDVIYLSTDGMVDQHNTENKKFGKQKFADLIQEHAFRPLNEQKEILEGALDDHQNGQEQRDDITLMGIRI